MNDSRIRASVAAKIKDLYTITNDLEEMFPGRHFTLDGHLVGSIGEVVAASQYNLQLLPASVQTHDATASDGRLVQIKATQRKSVSLSSCPDYLLVFQIGSDGSISEIYNGKGAPVWDAAGKMGKNGQRPISLAKLKQMMENSLEEDKIPQMQK